MNNFKKSQLLLLSLLVVLLTIAPLLSSSLRPTYLYFITNLLIIALGAEAGLLSFFSKPLDEKKNAQKLLTSTTQASPSSLDRIDEEQKIVDPDHQISTEKKPKAVEKSFSEKIVGVVKVEKVKKCPSMPSLFFIGGGEPSEGDHMSEDHYYEEEEKELGDLSGQELFTKAEMFIGNFYRQLKMQREESWKKINGFYQRAF